MKASYPYNEGVRSLSYNFINERENSGSKSASSYLSASLDLKWNILDWLTYQFTGGYSDNNSTNEAWESERTFYIAENYRGYDFNSVSPASKEFKAALLPFGGELYNGSSDVLAWNIQNKVSFRESLRKIIVLTYWLVRKSLQQLQRIALKLFLDMWQNEESKWFNRPL